MNQLEYLPGIAGQSVQLDGPSAFVGIAEEMRSREWDYDLGYRDLVTATRPARTVDVTFHADFGTADRLRRVADADVMARTPGTFVAQKEWKQRGYILASDVDDIHYGRLSTGLKIALLDGAWWRLVKRSFVPEITTPEYRSATGETVTASGASGAPLHALTVDGKAVQDGTPTPSNPVPVEVVEPVGGVFGISINGVVTPIDLQGNVLASLPDGTKDVLTIDSTGAVTLEKNVGVAVIDGVTVKCIGKTDYGNNVRANITLPGQLNVSSSERLNCYNDKFRISTEPVNTPSQDSSAYSYELYASFSFAVIPIAALASSDTAGINAWFAANPTTVVYPLATPQTIDLGHIDMPAVPLDAQISVTAAVTPTITAEWQISRDAYLDYPHDYPHDYQATSSTSDVTPSVLTPSDVYLAVFGPAVNPYVIVGGNRYQVNVTVPAGGYLVVDGRDKTIQLTLADGTVQNVFSSGVRGGGAGGGSYIFEQIPAGESEVTYDGSFGFDLGWYEEEGEPPWSLS